MFRKLKNKKGFSMVELIVVIAVLAVIAVILVPTITKYVENSRAQKDVSAMDEVVNAVQLSMSEQDCYDEMFRYSCTNNYVTYTDSSGNYGQQLKDEEYWAPDGAGRATTITFNPIKDEFGRTYYSLDRAIINDMTYGNGSVAQSRPMEGALVEDNQCYLKNATTKDDEITAYVYNNIRKIAGNDVFATSATYKNSSYTVFIRFIKNGETFATTVTGSFNGTNLHEGSQASVGSHTSRYENDDPDKPIKEENGGTTTPTFTNSDLMGSGTLSGKTPDYKNNGGQGSGTNVQPKDSLNDYTWAELQTLVKAGLTAEEYKNIYHLELGAKKEDKYILVDYDNYDGLVFMFNSGIKAQMNATATNAGGYANSAMIQTVDGIYNSLENENKELYDAIKEVNIQCTNGKYNTVDPKTYSIDVHMFLPSVREVSASHSASDATLNTEGGSTFDYFANADTEQTNRTKIISSSDWWLRSAYCGSSYYFWFVYSGGSISNKFASNSYAVLPAFVIGDNSDFVGNGGGNSPSDTNAPIITLNQTLSEDSENPTVVDAAEFTLSGTVTDDTGVASLKINENNVTVNNDGSFDTILALTKNEVVEVKIVAADNSGNVAEKNCYILYKNDSVTIKSCLNDYTWAELKTLASKGLTAEIYQKTYNLYLGAKKEDKYVLVDYDNYGGFVFMYYSEDKDAMSYDGNQGGYASSRMKNKIVDKIYTDMTEDSELRNAIKSVTITCNDGKITPNATYEVTVHIFLPSVREVSKTAKYGDGYTDLNDALNAEGSTFDYFDADDEIAKERRYNIHMSSWWLRSANGSYDDRFWCVGSGGDVSYNFASNYSDIVPAFVIGNNPDSGGNGGGTGEKDSCTISDSCQAEIHYESCPMYQSVDFLSKPGAKFSGYLTNPGCHKNTDWQKHTSDCYTAEEKILSWEELKLAENRTKYGYGYVSDTMFASSAFYSCKNLISINIPDGFTDLSTHVFSGCENLTSVKLPSDLTYTGQNTFVGCTSLTSVKLPDTLTKVGYNAFSGCTNLVLTELPASVTIIDSDAFYGCTSLTSIELPANLTSIGNNSFYNCKSLTSINIPDTVTYMGSSAFHGCTSLTSINLPEGVTSVSNSTFNGCTNLTSINIPDNVTGIGYNAFRNCTNITSIELPDTVTSIENWVFYGCTGLRTINFNGKVEDWNNITFGSMWNYQVPATEIICSDGKVTL